VVAKIAAEAKGDETIVMSGVTHAKITALQRKMDFTTAFAEPPIQPSLTFTRFDWKGRSEKDGTPEARSHLQTQLSYFGAKFGRGSYKIIDVHAMSNFLSYESGKLGKFRGGTDLVIVPYSTANSGAVKEICVLFELKTSDAVAEAGGLGHFNPQAYAELIAARCNTHQPQVLVVLTDLTYAAQAFTLTFVPATEGFAVLEYNLTLEQMAVLVVEFLELYTIPDPHYKPMESRQAPNEVCVLSFKRKFGDVDAGLAWERFQELVEDTRPWSKERAHLTAQLFTDCGIEQMPTLAYPSMYI
jgi:hypothetical protein